MGSKLPNTKNAIANIDIQEVITLIKKRDIEAFSYLYDTYAGALYGIILKIVNDHEEGCTVLQKTFLFIFREIHSYDKTKERLFTWMLKIACDLALKTSGCNGCPNGEECKNKDHWNTTILKMMPKPDFWKKVSILTTN